MEQTINILEEKTITPNGKKSFSNFVNKFMPASKIENDFKRVERATNKFIKQYQRSNQALYTALYEIYVFTNHARENESEFQKFIESHGEKINKRAKENNYFPVVKIAFNNENQKQKWSKYANVLRLAEHEQVEPENFKNWINNYGIEGAYKRSRKMFGLYTDPQGRQKKVNKGRDNILKSQPLAQTKVSGNVDHVGFGEALVYINEKGKLTIYGLTETDESNMENVFIQYA